MIDMDILSDILKDRILNQQQYNESMLLNRNPEIRAAFTKLRDDETRDIMILQQKMERLRNSSDVVVKIYSSYDVT